MTDAKDILNELKWRENRELDEATIYYVDQGAPNDEKIITGLDIQDMEASFFSTSEAMIPYHRIFRIEYDGKTIFERKR